MDSPGGTSQPLVEIQRMKLIVQFVHWHFRHSFCQPGDFARSYQGTATPACVAPSATAGPSLSHLIHHNFKPIDSATLAIIE